MALNSSGREYFPAGDGCKPRFEPNRKFVSIGETALEINVGVLCNPFIFPRVGTPGLPTRGTVGNLFPLPAHPTSNPRKFLKTFLSAADKALTDYAFTARRAMAHLLQ
jgi:hypothetical protein